MTGGIIRADSPKDPQSRPGDGFKYLSLFFSTLAKLFFTSDPTRPLVASCSTAQLKRVRNDLVSFDSNKIKYI